LVALYTKLVYCQLWRQQTWLEFAVKCGYLEAEVARPLYEVYDRILGKLVAMIRQPEKWVIGGKRGQGGKVTG
jgi:hypothetical protein